MIENYEDLKKHCDTIYPLYGIPSKIGKLEDIELEAIKNTLKGKIKTLTLIERRQLNSVQYVLNYRGKCHSDKAIEKIYSRRIDKTVDFVNNLRIWNEPIKNVKTLVNN